MVLLHSAFKLGGKGGFVRISSPVHHPVLKTRYTKVFRATDQTTVEKSRLGSTVRFFTMRRVSFDTCTVIRPSLAVYAVGRFDHFEYLAMELLGQSLGDIEGQHRETL